MKTFQDGFVPRVALPLIAVLLPLLTASGCRQSRPENVILIVIDTLRADHLSLYGYHRPTSPRLEEWATRGRVFERAFATSSWTLPTFGSVLTGLWPAQHAAGTRLEDRSKKWRRGPLSPAVATMPEILQRNGFTTGAIVNNAFLREHFGAARGFQHYDYEKGRRAAAVVDLAERWLAEHGDDRFFLMIHMIDPHLPYVPPQEFRGRFGDPSVSTLEPRGRKNIVQQLPELTETDRGALISRYDEEIASVDAELGRLFHHLEESGLWRRTMVILTSDHGEELFDHGGFEHGHSMYQEVLRVPLIFWGPGVRASREPAPVSLVDLAPTVFEATGVSTAVELSGRSLWSLLVSGAAPERREILAQNTLWGREHKTLVAWPYKLILDPASGRRQLFDLSRDPQEREDLAETERLLAQKLERRLTSRLAELDVGSADSAVELSAEMEEELRALGYLD